jgi:hypothetical protein
MKLTTTYWGGDDLFEGDRTVWLRALPAGAIVTQATLTLKPAQRALDAQFQETFTFSSLANSGELLASDWGITQIANQSVEIDFHARRTLAAVQGTGGALTLQVDLGGAYVGVSNDGTIGKSEFPVNFATTTLINLPGLTVSKFRLSPTGTGAPINSNVTRVSIRSVPTNLAVRLGQTPAFWTRPGELTVADTSPDFALLLNAFLLTAQPQDGFYVIPFIVHSDSLARLEMSVAIEYRLAHSVLPPHLPELNAVYGFSTLPSLDDQLTTVQIPQGAKLVAGQSTAKITGEFQPTRIALGLIGEEPPKTVVVEVSPVCSVAQLLEAEQEIEVTGFDLPLANTQPGLAGLNLSIQTDADGKPSGEVLKTMEVVIEKPLPGQSSWGSATLPSPFRILPRQKQRYWLILQSLVGQAFWLSIPAPAGKPPEIPLQCSRNGGLSWRDSSVTEATTTLKALFRIRTVPDRFTIPVQLQIGKGANAVIRRLDEFAPLGRIEFNFDFTDKLRDYLDHAATSPCGAGELLINGSFDQPIPDDANRRLFGFDTAETDEGRINGNVNLSRGVNLSQERFIRLTLEQSGSDFPDTPVRIDCAGANPSRTSGLEIENRIDLAMHQDIAEYSTDYYGGAIMILRAPGGEFSPTLRLNYWYDLAVPQGWQKSSESRGQIGRLKLPVISEGSVSQRSNAALAPQRTIVMLQSLQLDGDNLPSPLLPLDTATPGTADLSQTIAVKATCTYLLQFHFLAFAQSSQSEPPRWQVTWQSADQQILKQDGGILPAFSPQHNDLRSNLISSAAIEDGSRAVSKRSEPTFVPVSVRLPAPAHATQATIRFEQPLGGILRLDDVSFAPTSESLSNATFSFLSPTDSLPVYWTLQSGWLEVPDPPDQDTPTTGIILDGSNSPEDVILVQTLPIPAGATDLYQLKVNAYSIGGAIANIENQPPNQRARVELHWLNNGSSTAAIILPLDGQGFPEQGWSGSLLPGTTDAEIRLIQPKNNGKLQVNSVSLTRMETTPVPLIFLGESPGQLTISSLQVAYE